MPLPKLTIVPAARTWVVRAGGAVIADSDSPMELIDGDEASEIYFPREDLGMAFLEAPSGSPSARTWARRASSASSPRAR